MVARLSEAPSFPAQGMLGQVWGCGALNHRCLRGRVGSPLPSGEEGVVTPQAPFSVHLSRPTKVPSSLLLWFISIPALSTSEMK